jgi:hypothetical protein
MTISSHSLIQLLRDAANPLFNGYGRKTVRVFKAAIFHDVSFFMLKSIHAIVTFDRFTMLLFCTIPHGLFLYRSLGPDKHTYD